MLGFKLATFYLKVNICQDNKDKMMWKWKYSHIYSFFNVFHYLIQYYFLSSFIVLIYFVVLINRQTLEMIER